MQAACTQHDSKLLMQWLCPNKNPADKVDIQSVMEVNQSRQKLRSSTNSMTVCYIFEVL